MFIFSYERQKIEATRRIVLLLSRTFGEDKCSIISFSPRNQQAPAKTQTHIHIHTHTHVHIHIHTHIHIHIHIHTQAHDRNLSVGLRNDWEQLDDLEASFDWALSEDCLFEGECGV